MDIPRQSLLGYGVMLLFNLLFVAATASVQMLQRRIPDFQLGVYRYAFGGFVTGLLLLTSSSERHKLLNLPRDCLKTCVFLAAIISVMNMLLFFASAVIPLSHMSFMLVTEMIFVVVVMHVVYDKVANFITILSIFVCIIGSFLLIQPWQDFKDGFIPGFESTFNVTQQGIVNNHHDDNHINATRIISSDESLSTKSGSNYVLKYLLFGYLAVMGGGMCDGMLLIQVRYRLQGVSPLVIFFLSSTFATPFGVLCCLYMEQPIWVSDPYVIMLAFIHMVGLVFSSLLHILACHLISPIQVSIMSNLTTVLQLVAQYTVLSGNLYGRHNAMEVIGCLMITVGVALAGLFSKEKDHEDLTA